MDVALAQVAALVANGNASLAADRDAASRVESGTTFRFVRTVRFERQEGRPPTPTAVETAVEGWYRRLPEWGVTALWLEPRPLAVPTLPPHIAAAFTNGSRSSIVTEGTEPRTRWIASWRIDRAPTETDRRVWEVEYVGREDVANLAPRPSIADAFSNLETVAQSARELARRSEWSWWASRFDRVLAAAASDDPRPSFHVDVLPPSADLDRRRLFTLACGSFVFGGMGSWNDTGPTYEGGEAEYQRVTEALYAAILDGVAAAVNPRDG